VGPEAAACKPGSLRKKKKREQRSLGELQTRNLKNTEPGAEWKKREGPCGIAPDGGSQEGGANAMLGGKIGGGVGVDVYLGVERRWGRRGSG